MAKDVAPELYEKISEDFDAAFRVDPVIRKLYKRVEERKATPEEVSAFAARAGEICSKVLRRNLTASTLPDGTLYYNIAERTVKLILGRMHTLIDKVCQQAQTALNEAAGVGIKAQEVPVDEERIEGIAAAASGVETLEEAHAILDEPVVNYAQHVNDESVRRNADFQYRAGLSPKIVRTAAGHCCDWCASLVGTYDYEDVKHGGDVFRRHRYCRCTVMFTIGGKWQDVHSRKWYDSERDARIARANEVEREKEQERSAKATMRSRIQSGQYSLKLSRQKYNEHIEGTPQYKNTERTRGQAPSRLTISYSEAQKLIDLHSGTGTPRTTRKGTVQDIEFASTNKVIGQYFDVGKQEWVDTKRFAIYHSSSGSHIVPTKPRRTK